jgi:hypothetical protein
MRKTETKRKSQSKQEGILLSTAESIAAKMGKIAGTANAVEKAFKKQVRARKSRRRKG